MNDTPPMYLPVRKLDSHKGDYGRVLLVGGSRGMAGAISLSAIAALRAGSGLVSAFVPEQCLETVAGFHPGIMTIPGANDDSGRFASSAATQAGRISTPMDAVGCGPGMSNSPTTYRIVERLLAKKPALVLDADAINALAENRWAESCEPRQSALVLTPHPGEFARLSGATAKNRDKQKAAAVELATRCGGVIVLKGGETFVTDGTSSWSCRAGNPGMATAGSGDVLTGVVTSLLGQGLSAWDAARLGVWVHGRAGNAAAQSVGMAGMTCEEILASIPLAMQAVLGRH